jgi:hypothetical protein
MDKIYQQASTTHVWLGLAPQISPHGEDDEQNASSALDDLRSWCQTDRDWAWMHRRLHSIDTLLSGPWFDRLWVVQEAVLSPHCVLHSGHAECDLDVSDRFEARHTPSRSTANTS